MRITSDLTEYDFNQTYKRPTICQAILDKDFETYRREIIVGDYPTSFPMFIERLQVSFENRGEHLCIAPLRRVFTYKYEGSCLEYMTENDYPEKWFIEAYRQHICRNSRKMYARKYQRCRESPYSVCRDDTPVEGYTWGIIKAIIDRDLETFNRWVDALWAGDKSKLSHMGMNSKRISIKNYLKSQDYPEEWYKQQRWRAQLLSKQQLEETPPRCRRCSKA